jgi:hypothetical protein
VCSGARCAPGPTAARRWDALRLARRDRCGGGPDARRFTFQAPRSGRAIFPARNRRLVVLPFGHTPGIRCASSYLRSCRRTRRRTCTHDLERRSNTVHARPRALQRPPVLRIGLRARGTDLAATGRLPVVSRATMRASAKRLTGAPGSHRQRPSGPGAPTPVGRETPGTATAHPPAAAQ